MTTHALNLASPGELIAAIPFLLGFHPRRSVVLMALRQRRLSLTQRLDLPDPGQELRGGRGDDPSAAAGPARLGPGHRLRGRARPEPPHHRPAQRPAGREPDPGGRPDRGLRGAMAVPGLRRPGLLPAGRHQGAGAGRRTPRRRRVRRRRRGTAAGPRRPAGQRRGADVGRAGPQRSSTGPHQQRGNRHGGSAAGGCCRLVGPGARPTPGRAAAVRVGRGGRAGQPPAGRDPRRDRRAADAVHPGAGPTAHRRARAHRLHPAADPRPADRARVAARRPGTAHRAVPARPRRARRPRADRARLVRVVARRRRHRPGRPRPGAALRPGLPAGPAARGDARPRHPQPPTAEHTQNSRTARRHPGLSHAAAGLCHARTDNLPAPTHWRSNPPIKEKLS